MEDEFKLDDPMEETDADESYDPIPPIPVERPRVIYELVPRICQCGCNRTFKVLPSSEKRFFSEACEQKSLGKDPTAGKGWKRGDPAGREASQKFKARIKELHSAGKKPVEIMSILNDEGITTPTGKKVKASHVSQITAALNALARGPRSMKKKEQSARESRSPVDRHKDFGKNEDDDSDTSSVVNGKSALCLAVADCAELESDKKLQVIRVILAE